MSDSISRTECRELASQMDRKYAIYLDQRCFEIEVSIFDDHVAAKTTLKNPDLSYVYPVEARMLHKSEGLDSRKALGFLIDYIDSYFEDFLTAMEATYLPIDFVDMEYEGYSFQIKGQILNQKAEKLADELLAADKPYDGPNIIF